MAKVYISEFAYIGGEGSGIARFGNVKLASVKQEVEV